MCSIVPRMGGNQRYPHAPPPDAQRRHCWVLEANGRPGPFPGLILEWRRLPSRDWQARVVYIPDSRKNESVEDWFAAARLKPVVDP